MRTFFFGIAIWSMACAALASSIFYVSFDGSPDAIGSLGDPFATIQAGVDAATTGDTVIVMSGVYQGPGNNNIQFAGKAITLRSDAGPEDTIIDGSDGSGRAFILTAGDSTNLVIEGFTISGINSFVEAIENEPGNPHYGIQYGTNGSAVLCEPGGGATFIDCRFVDNQAHSFFTTLTIGSPGYIFYKFVYLADGSGGAISMTGGEIVLSNCFFSGNHAGYAGGAISAQSNSILKIYNSIFEQCEASLASEVAWVTIGSPGDPFFQVEVYFESEYRGGAIHLNASTGIIEQCTFASNHAGIGGGVAAENNSALYLSDVHFLGNVANNNTSSRAGGGAVFLEQSDLFANQCNFQNNKSGQISISQVITIGVPGDPFYNVIPKETGITGGGGLYATGSHLVVMSNCQFTANHTMVYGGAVYIEDVNAVMMDQCTFSSNAVVILQSDESDPSGGGALYISNVATQFTFRNCTLTDNDASNGSETTTIITIGEPDNAFYYRSLQKTRVGSIGGAALLRNTPHVIGENIFLRGNRAGQAGGLFISACPDVVLHNLIASDNQASYTTNEAMTITRIDDVVTTFIQASEQFGKGGALLLNNSAAVLSGGRIEHNGGGWGAAIGMVSSEVQIASIMMTDNFSERAIQSVTYTNEFVDTPPRYTGFSSNHVDFALAGDDSIIDMNHITLLRTGGAFSNSAVVAHNTIVWESPWVFDESATFTSDFSIVLGNLDPRLTRTGRLQHDSPAIDAGLVFPAITLDFEGEAFAGVAPDIGADEFVDSDGDLLADMWELTYYTNLLDVATDTDDDVDQASALHEYIAGTDPRLRATNGEDIPDGWLIYAGLDPLMPHQRFDPDEDDFTNLEEYLADTDPLDANSFLFLEGIALSDHQSPQISWYGAASRWYRLEALTDPESGWLLITNGLPGQGTMLTFAWPDSWLDPSDAIQMRIKASLTP